ncbi:MAG: hypothetical protein K6B38_00265 [Ruminococcus sp.]|nr:hypothetical protein [Ruminococcus sp.]
MDNNSEEKSTGTILISVILASWILGTLIALFKIPDNGDRSWKTIFAVGQFFAGIGLVTTVSELIKRKFLNAVTSAFIVTGGVMVYEALKYRSAGLHEREQIIKAVPFIATLGIPLFCLAIMIHSIAYPKHMRKMCTMPVTGICTEVRMVTRYKDGRKYHRYIPVLEISFNSEPRQIFLNEERSEDSCPMVGQQKQIMIDPNDPENFYDEEHNENTKAIVLGLGTILALSVVMEWVIWNYVVRR